MRLPLLSSACLVALSLTMSPLLAQEGPAPVAPEQNIPVQNAPAQVAPVQPAPPQSDASAVLPSLPSIDSPNVQEGNVLPSDAPAAAASPLPVPPASSGQTANEATAAPVPAPPASAEPQVHTDLYTIVMSSHWVVMAVMLLLAVASFAVLVILIHKLVEYALAFGKLRRSALALSGAKSLAQAETAVQAHKGPAAEIIRAASEEFELAKADPTLLSGVRERTSGALARIEANAAQNLRSATGLLASIGSLAPFIGLFGTVFGIMNSFLAIAESKTTNLAVVAPGIAEALFATAIGLAAAIPAVLVYNICARKLARYRNTLGDVAAATERLQSRDLDRLVAHLKAER